MRGCSALRHTGALRAPAQRGQTRAHRAISRRVEMTRPESGTEAEETIMELAQLQQAWTERGFNPTTTPALTC